MAGINLSPILSSFSSTSISLLAVLCQCFSFFPCGQEDYACKTKTKTKDRMDSAHMSSPELWGHFAVEDGAQVTPQCWRRAGAHCDAGRCLMPLLPGPNSLPAWPRLAGPCPHPPQPLPCLGDICIWSMSRQPSSLFHLFASLLLCFLLISLFLFRPRLHHPLFSLILSFQT